MNQATVYIDPVGHSTVGWTQAAGMPGDTRFLFKTPANLAYPNIADMAPQLVLKPYTNYCINAYDIVIDDPTGAAGLATIPGSVMVDRFHIEVYQRNTLGQPVRMLAAGRVDLNGYAYTSSSPISPATYAQGPSGPAGPVGSTGAQGPAGQPGERGSRWYTGAGAPTAALPDNRVQGDMYLDESTGDVWEWDASSSTWMSFRGK
jgi:hypothetical protein